MVMVMVYSGLFCLNLGLMRIRCVRGGGWSRRPRPHTRSQSAQTQPSNSRRAAHTDQHTEVDPLGPAFLSHICHHGPNTDESRAGTAAPTHDKVTLGKSEGKCEREDGGGKIWHGWHRERCGDFFFFFFLNRRD